MKIRQSTECHDDCHCSDVAPTPTEFEVTMNKMQMADQVVDTARDQASDVDNPLEGQHEMLALSRGNRTQEESNIDGRHKMLDLIREEELGSAIIADARSLSLIHI